MNEKDMDMLKEYLSYDPETGVFTWRKKRGNRIPGDRAGRKDGEGYVILVLHGKQFRAHRIAWMMTYGPIPNGMLIDHVNFIRNDNRISNLRICTITQSNRHKQRSKKCKYKLPKGVTLENGRYRARIMCNGKNLHLGSFGSVYEAHDAYVDKAKQLHGEFACVDFNPVRLY